MCKNKKNKENEEKFINYLNKNHNYNFIRNPQKFNTFDAIDKEAKILLEIKFRDLKKTAWRTTIIGQNKIEKYKTDYINKGYTYLIGVAWTDNWGLYNYKIEDEPTFYTSSINPKEIKRNELNKADYKVSNTFLKPHINIPVKLFETIKEFKPVCLIVDDD